MITREAYETIDNSVSEFCSECIASADVADCESCVMTRFIDYVIPKCLFYRDGKKDWLREGTLVRFIPYDGTETIYHKIHIIDATHLDAVRYTPGGGEIEDATLTLHHAQYESIIDQFGGIVDISGKNGWENLKGGAHD